MGTLTQNAFVTAIRLDLADSGEAIWPNTDSDAEIMRGLTRAVSDLSRFYPRNRIYDLKLSHTVTGEEVTCTAQGTAYDLAYKPVKPKSVTVTEADAGATCTEDTDYTIDYYNGTITAIAGGLIAAGEVATVSYTRSKIGIDVSALDIINVYAVEYPIGGVPQTFVSYDYDGTFVWIKSQSVETSQSEVSDSNHIAIYYQTHWNDPEAAVAGAWPSFLDDTICTAAEAYCCYQQAFTALQLAITNEALATAVLTAANAEEQPLLLTALGEMATYLNNNSDEDAAAILKDVTDLAAEMYTKVVTDLDDANTILDEVDTTDLGLANYGSEALIVSASGSVDGVNTGKNVPENYTAMAQAAIAQGQVRVASASAMIQEAGTRIGMMAELLARSGGYIDIAMGFGKSAELMIADIANQMAEAEHLYAAAALDLEVCDRWYNLYLQLRTEAWSVWQSPNLYAKDNTTTAVRQSP